MTSKQVQSYIKALDPSKATGLDGLGPKIFKLAINSQGPIIAFLINKTIHTGQFINEMKCAKVFPILRVEINLIHRTLVSILPTISKLFERHVNKHLMILLNTSLFMNINQAFVKNIAARLHGQTDRSMDIVLIKEIL